VDCAPFAKLIELGVKLQVAPEGGELQLNATLA
jgi:hypothetical protein